MTKQAKLNKDLSVYALEAGRMIGLRRTMTIEEVEAVVCAFQSDTPAYKHDVAHLHAWVCVKMDKDHPIVAGAVALSVFH